MRDNAPALIMATVHLERRERERERESSCDCESAQDGAQHSADRRHRFCKPVRRRQQIGITRSPVEWQVLSSMTLKQIHRPSMVIVLVHDRSGEEWIAGDEMEIDHANDQGQDEDNTGRHEREVTAA
jgi:hypothetical protein